MTLLGTHTNHHTKEHSSNCDFNYNSDFDLNKYLNPCIFGGSKTVFFRPHLSFVWVNEPSLMSHRVGSKDCFSKGLPLFQHDNFDFPSFGRAGLDKKSFGFTPVQIPVSYPKGSGIVKPRNDEPVSKNLVH